MIVSENIKALLLQELTNAKSIWVASAMVSRSGWLFIQNNVPASANQYFLIGTDLSTDPFVFDCILKSLYINARVYKTTYTFHPKVYLIRLLDNSFVAFLGSSNTTDWGLEKNVEMNFRVTDQNECNKLLSWFNTLFSNGHLVTESFVDDYKKRFVKIAVKAKEIAQEAENIKLELSKNDEQFFSRNDHDVFQQKYHRINSQNLQIIRKEVRNKFIKLHQQIYPHFKASGLTDLFCHHQSREIVSRHFFNRFSGNYVNAMWLHYGKSQVQLSAYSTEDRSINRPDSFINNVRIQVIIHETSLGIWLVLGRNNGSIYDRAFLRQQIMEPGILQKFFDAFKKLGDLYYISTSDVQAKDIQTPSELILEIQKESIEKYFFIGTDIHWLDPKLSKNNISVTVLSEIKKLYPLYQIMRHPG